MALVPTVPSPPANDVAVGSDGFHTQSWSLFFQRLSRAVQSLAGTDGGGDGSLGIAGVTDGSEAASGDVGEFVRSETTAPVVLTSAVETSVLTLDLPAGDWDVTGWVGFIVDAGTSVDLFGFGIGALDTTLLGAAFPSDTVLGAWVGTKRSNAAGGVTVSLQADVVFTGTVSAQAILRARRAR